MSEELITLILIIVKGLVLCLFLGGIFALMTIFINFMSVYQSGY